ncbi:hypothetical protein PMAYCL1PPCAC_31634, partial [Pristionchus mayeri]
SSSFSSLHILPALITPQSIAMRGVVRQLASLSLLCSMLSALEVIDFVPDRQFDFALTSTSGSIEKRQISVKGPVRLRCVGTPDKLTWQYQEGLEIPKAAKQHNEGSDALILDFEVFDESMDGLYTCQRYETSEKKRMRLFFFDDVMPSGFHECAADQKAKCTHAKTCRAADETNHISCVCMKDWQGENCDTPVLVPAPNSSLSTGMPLVWVVFSIVVLVGIIVAVKCHNENEKSELVPTTDPGEMV